MKTLRFPKQIHVILIITEKDIESGFEGVPNNEPNPSILPDKHG